MPLNPIFSTFNKIPSLNRRYSGIATIFALHRVAKYDVSSVNADLNISPESLETFIVFLKDKGYDFISIDELHDILINRLDASNKVLFTLDDGYLDNYTTAYPIFKKYNVPFTVYVTTNFPDKKAILWWYVIERLINTNDEVILNGHQPISCKTASELKGAFKYIREQVMHLNQNDLEKELNELFKHYPIDWYEDVNKLSMSWDNLIKMNQDDLATIGGHTRSHPVISRLNEEQLHDEVVTSNQILEEYLGAPIEHFAYPYGRKQHASLREFELIDSLGLKTAVTTRKGNIFSEHSTHLSCLPRRMLSENYPYYKMIKPSKIRIATD